MRIVTPENENEYADRMIAIALEGKRSVYYATTMQEILRFRALLEFHMDTVSERLPETKLYWANDRYVVDNNGRKGYVLLTHDFEQLLSLEVTEAFAQYGTDDRTLAVLEQRENKKVIGGTYEKGLRW